ncbi:MAG TPA: hypothetical protein VGL46_09045 [Pseudonocardiaceae bacterium]
MSQVSALARGRAPDPGLLICDRLDMLVTGDPISELDAALRTAGATWCAAHQHDDAPAAERLMRWINLRLDQRNEFIPDRGEPPSSPDGGRPDHRQPAWASGSGKVGSPCDPLTECAQSSDAPE